MRERRHKNRRRSERPFEIDLVVPGFAAATGRQSDRVRCSAETRDGKILQERRAMVADLGRRLMHDVLAARVNGLFTTQELELAYKRGPESLRKLADRSKHERLDELVSRWMQVTRIRTKQASKEHVQSFINFCGGNAVATTSDLTTERIERWLSSLTDARRSNAGRKRNESCSSDALSARTRRAKRSAEAPTRPVSAATRNRYRASLSAFCTFLVDTAEAIPKHPVRGKIEAEPERLRMKPHITGLDWSKYLEFVAADPLAPPASVLVVSVLRFSGADIGEVLGYTSPEGVRVPGMRVRDVISEASGPQLQFKRQKVDTSPPRRVPCPQSLFHDLTAHIQAFGLSKTDELFGMVGRSHFEALHRRARRAIGLPDLRIKDFRHLAAIGWVKSTVPLTRIQKWLGHSSIEQTAVYADHAPDYDHEQPLVEKAMILATTQT
jgi:integrase